MPVVCIENFFYVTQHLNKQESEVGADFTIADLLKRGEELCPMAVEQVKQAVHPAASQEKIDTACFLMNVMSQFLQHMVGLDADRLLHARFSLNGSSLGWTTGLLAAELPTVLPAQQRNEL
eukprot:Platyproteum_vivax@DN6243_c0_g1_i1.p1